MYVSSNSTDLVGGENGRLEQFDVKSWNDDMRYHRI